jgi:hypothetical protein
MPMPPRGRPGPRPGAGMGGRSPFNQGGRPAGPRGPMMPGGGMPQGGGMPGRGGPMGPGMGMPQQPQPLPPKDQVCPTCRGRGIIKR